MQKREVKHPPKPLSPLKRLNMQSPDKVPGKRLNFDDTTETVKTPSKRDITRKVQQKTSQALSGSLSVCAGFDSFFTQTNRLLNIFT